MKVNKSIAVMFKVIVIEATLIYLLFLADKLFLERMLSGMFTPGYEYNLIPFKTISTYIEEYNHYNFNTWFDNLFGNILLFIPFDFVLPYFLSKYRRVGPFSLFTVCLIVTVEVLQLLTHTGSFDVDDIILNTAGALIGFYAYCLCLKILQSAPIRVVKGG